MDCLPRLIEALPIARIFLSRCNSSLSPLITTASADTLLASVSAWAMTLYANKIGVKPLKKIFLSM